MNQHQSLIIVGALLVLIVLLALSGCAPTPTLTPLPILDPMVGVNSLNDPRQGNGNVSEATSLGVGRDRWAVEWFWVEQPWREDDPIWVEGMAGDDDFRWFGNFDEKALDPAKEDFNFNVTDAATAAKNAPLETLVALHGIPRIYDCTAEYVDENPLPPSTDDVYQEKTECNIAADPNKSRIEGLFGEAVVNGNINPANRWANFAFSTMQYLKETGDIKEYEVWNEPDRQWRSGQDPSGADWIDDYARLIEVTGLAAQAVSDDITLVLGGPSSSEDLYDPGGWINDAWTAAQEDPTATSY